MKKLTIGILAHVDAGKTTLSEAILYTCGAIKKAGRVDNRDSFLDNETEERKRGITIFSKQAHCTYKDLEITFIDTPGHADFSGEMERSLQILDYAILVISGTDGAQAHTSTLIKLLEENGIPVFVFITKMDLCRMSRDELMSNLHSRVSENCVDFTDGYDPESVALLSDDLLEIFLNEGCINNTEIAELVSSRKLLPCVFGSGLKFGNVDRLLDVIYDYSATPSFSDVFGARVFKIARDNHGKRLTFIKVTGGTLNVRDTVGEEKVSQIRLYSGSKYESTTTVSAGDVCALLGLDHTVVGQGLGYVQTRSAYVLAPVLKYKVILPDNISPVEAFPLFKQLEEEDPLLNVVFNSKYNDIEIQLMGKVQTSILKSLIYERFGLDVYFDAGRIMYKETINGFSDGIGHYEPLKHYAEVHLLLESLPRGSGIQFATGVPTDDLDLNWQRLIMTHLEEKQHLGVLTGAPVTDIRFTLIAGKAHLKHTEGGDFRQATYRAVRHGLMNAESILLEPMYEFIIEVPPECLGRAISDIHQKNGTTSPPWPNGEFSAVSGTVPVAGMEDYASEIQSYTGGRGRISLKFAGYSECHNSAEIIEKENYDPTSDIENTPDSVFCSHGAGVNIPWDKVEEYCHIPPLRNNDEPYVSTSGKTCGGSMSRDIDEEELEAIMLREFGPIKRKSYNEPFINAAPPVKNVRKKYRIIVDGYNVIHSWDNLKNVAQNNLDLARETLINTLVNYSAFSGSETVLVFDAYQSDYAADKKYDTGGLHVVYTEHAESADAYIEKIISEIGKNENVKIVSSDSMIQLAAIKDGVLRVSSREFKEDVDTALGKMREMIN